MECWGREGWVEVPPCEVTPPPQCHMLISLGRLDPPTPRMDLRFGIKVLQGGGGEKEQERWRASERELLA